MKQTYKKKAESVANNLKLLQKEMRGYDSILFDLSTQARSNRKMIGTEFFLAFKQNFWKFL